MGKLKKLGGIVGSLVLTGVLAAPYWTPFFKDPPLEAAVRRSYGNFIILNKGKDAWPAPVELRVTAEDGNSYSCQLDQAVREGEEISVGMSQFTLGDRPYNPAGPWVRVFYIKVRGYRMGRTKFDPSSLTPDSELGR